MAVGKCIKIVPVYAVLSPRQLESNEVSFFNPAQDGNFADTTVPGNDAGGEIFRIWYLKSRFQFIPP